MIRAHQSGDATAMDRVREKMEAMARALEKKHDFTALLARATRRDV